MFGPGRDRLLVDGEAVAPLVVARSSGERRRGLLGTSAVEGALWLPRCPSVHMVGMHYPIDVAMLDRHGVCRLVLTLRVGGMTRPRLRVRTCVEAAAGAMAAWGVAPGRLLAVGARG